jgi:hypothetical protein
MASQLVVHCGGRTVTRDELATIAAPQPTATWFPARHIDVLSTVEQALDNGGLKVRRARYATSKEDARFFATLDLEDQISEGVGLSIGVRNANDQSCPRAFVCGSNVFVCDNLAFFTDMVVLRKHTRFGETRFSEAVSLAVQSMALYKDAEKNRIEAFRNADISDMQAESIILRAFEQGVVNTRQLPGIIKEWREPSFQDFQPRNAWSLYNDFTTVLNPLAETRAQKHALLTMQLGALIGKSVGYKAPELITEVSDD